MDKSAIGSKELDLLFHYTASLSGLCRSPVFLLLAVCNTLNDVSVRYVGRVPKLCTCVRCLAQQTVPCVGRGPQILHMWQSCVEIEGYSVEYFDCIAAFEAPYC